MWVVAASEKSEQRKRKKESKEGRSGNFWTQERKKERKKEKMEVVFEKMRIKKKKTTAPGLRAWSPTALLSGPERA